MVVVAAAVGLAGGFGGPLDAHPRAAGHPSATSGLISASTAVEAAVVPVRAEAWGATGVRSAAADPLRHGPARGLLPLVAVLLGLAGLLGARSGVVRPPTAGCHPLRARRHAIALRAPPSLRCA
jgi:hypothetical protein